jgi:adenosylcobinamide-phosphate synthase
MWFAIKVAGGFLLDLIFGDPQWFPHPVRGIGLLIEKLEKILYPWKQRLWTGGLLALLVIGITYVSFYFLVKLHWVVEVLFIYTIFATRALGNEAMTMYQLLKEKNTEEARHQLGFLVSRETSEMHEEDMIRSTIETVSENVTDGITAPLFYLLIGGVPLAMAYKAASTLDSMVGYKNDRYILFGRVSARIDDVLNFIPARITAFCLVPIAALMCGNSFSGTLRIVSRDRLKHASPNSAHTEAAFAGALGIRLGGVNRYFGKEVVKPFIGDEQHSLKVSHIKEAVWLMYVTSVIAVGVGVGIYIFKI